MSYRNLPEDLVELVNPVDVRGYALAEGWERVEGVNGTIALYRHPGSDLDQLIVPLDPALDGYGRSMADVIVGIAERARRPSISVREGLARAVVFYREHLERYVERLPSPERL